MANLNKVMLIGRLTRDPETRSFQNGGKVAVFGFAVNNRKKNKEGEWDDEPVFIECEAFNRDKGQKLADLVEKYLAKGKQCYLEGRLKLDQWQDKDSGAKRSKIKVIVDQVQFLEPGKKEGGSGEGGSGGYRGDDEGAGDYQDQPSQSSGGGDDDIPF